MAVAPLKFSTDKSILLEWLAAIVKISCSLVDIWERVCCGCGKLNLENLYTVK